MDISKLILEYLKVVLAAPVLFSIVSSPYKTVRVNNFNKLHIIAYGCTWQKIRRLQRKT